MDKVWFHSRDTSSLICRMPLNFQLIWYSQIKKNSYVFDREAKIPEHTNNPKNFIQATAI
jgi:hypothetical protein